MRKDVYEIITERIIAQLESGVVPWHKPWSGGEQHTPRNLISNKAYRGINIFLLGCQGYESPYWLSFKQCRKAGGHVVKGQKASIAVFWKWLDVDKKDPETEEIVKDRIPMLRYYNVWNTEQCADLDHKRIKEMQESTESEEHEFDPIDSCEALISAMPTPPSIQHIENRAYYRPSADRVNMPKREKFAKVPEYYSTLFHELCHSTGHESRLGRQGITETHFFGDREYSQEELVAEMGAAFLCGVVGIENETIDNSAAYINGWLTKLRDRKNRKMLVMAGSQAQKAADYIRNIKFEN